MKQNPFEGSEEQRGPNNARAKRSYAPRKQGARERKVRLGNGKWSCSCPGWKKNKHLDCRHIRIVKAGEGFGDKATGHRRQLTRVRSKDAQS